jgi:hypothetical protein
MTYIISHNLPKPVRCRKLGEPALKQYKPIAKSPELLKQELAAKTFGEGAYGIDRPDLIKPVKPEQV